MSMNTDEAIDLASSLRLAARKRRPPVLDQQCCESCGVTMPLNSHSDEAASCGVCDLCLERMGLGEDNSP